MFDDDFGLSDDDLSEEESDDSMSTEVHSLSREAVEDVSRELDENHCQLEVGSEANSGLFADCDDGLEKEDLALLSISLSCIFFFVSFR